MPGTQNTEMKQQVTLWGYYCPAQNGGNGVGFNSLSPNLHYGRCPCSHNTAEAIKQGNLKKSLRKDAMVVIAHAV